MNATIRWWRTESNPAVLPSSITSKVRPIINLKKTKTNKQNTSNSLIETAVLNLLFFRQICHRLLPCPLSSVVKTQTAIVRNWSAIASTPDTTLPPLSRLSAVVKVPCRHRDFMAFRRALSTIRYAKRTKPKQQNGHQIYWISFSFFVSFFLAN